MKDIITTKNANFIAKNNNSPSIPHKIEECKMAHYREVWKAMNAAGDNVYSFRTLCPSPFCRNPVYACTFDELDAIRKGECVCEYCRQRGKSKRIEQWERVCPEAFRAGETATDRTRLEKLATLSLVWGAGSLPEHSIFVYGKTGTQKSRTLFAILEEKTLPSSTSFRVLGGGELRETFLACSKNYAEINDVKKALAEVDLLCFDDFAQDFLSGTMFADLWSVLDRRFRSGKKTVFLSNATPVEIVGFAGGGEQARSLARRIQDFCKFVRF